MMRIAILCQAGPPPIVDGIRKPMKPGGYADSGADIACALLHKAQLVVTPHQDPDPSADEQWVFPDTQAGIAQALDMGAEILWLNTILFAGHPVESLQGQRVIGQSVQATFRHDDKWLTNQMLREAGLPVAKSMLVAQGEQIRPVLIEEGHVVLKPIRGRGSQGVVVCEREHWRGHLDALVRSDLYGSRFIAEQYLPGHEITITVMPPGRFRVGGEEVEKQMPWALPPVERFDHRDGVLPYNGLVPVSRNSRVLDRHVQASEALRQIIQACEQAAYLVEAKAPIRVDCRADRDGAYFIFDLNMKPNMTGRGRPGRDDQNNLAAIAAEAIGWDYPELIGQIARQSWIIGLQEHADK